MTKQEVFDKIKPIIIEKLNIEDESKVTLDASFRKDLEADSLDTYELIYAIENELEVQIPDDKANEFSTVGDAAEYLSTIVK